jgi:hypothetical protein
LQIIGKIDAIAGAAIALSSVSVVPDAPRLRSAGL